MNTINDIIHLANDRFYKRDLKNLKNMISFFEENDIPFLGEKEGFNLLSLLVRENDNLSEYVLNERANNFIDYFTYLKERNIILNTNVRAFDSDTLYSFCYYGTAFTMEKNQPMGKTHIISDILDSFRNKKAEDIIPVLEYLIDNFKGEPFLHIRIYNEDLLSNCIKNEECASLLIRLIDLNPVVHWKDLTNFKYSGTELKYKFLENPTNKSCFLHNILVAFMIENSFTLVSKNINIGEVYNSWLYRNDFEDSRLFSDNEIYEKMEKIKKDTEFYNKVFHVYNGLISIMEAKKEKKCLVEKLNENFLSKGLKRL